MVVSFIFFFLCIYCLVSWWCCWVSGVIGWWNGSMMVFVFRLLSVMVRCGFGCVVRSW